MEVGTADQFGDFVETDVDDFYCNAFKVSGKWEIIFHIPVIDIDDEPYLSV